MNITHSIGLDIHKSSARYHILDHDFHKVSRGPLRAETTAVEQLLEKLSADPATVLVVAEATGMLHLDFCQAFQRAGCQVAVINPLYKCNRTSKNAIRDNKTDRLDAEALAELGLNDQNELLHRFRYRCPVEFFKLQRYESSRQILRKSLTNIIKHTATAVHTLFPELEALKLSLKSVSVRRLLRDHPGPARIATLDCEQLRSYVGDKAVALKQAAAHSFANQAMVAACEEGLLGTLLDSIDQIETKIDQLDQTIEQLLLDCVDQQTVQLAKSIPGFGAKTTPAILAFIAPEHIRGGKRKTARRLQALFGADPRIKESGRWKGQTKISKRGSRIARTALFQAAFCGMTHDPQLRLYYDSLKARGKKHKQAIVDLMRKQLQRLVSVLIDQKAFTHIQEPS